MNYNEIYTSETLQYMASEVNSWDGSLENLAYYEMDQFNEFMSGHDPEFIACRIHFGDFNPMDDYFSFDGYGNLISLSSFELGSELSDNAFEIIERYKELSAEGAVDGDLLDDIENEMEGK